MISIIIEIVLRYTQICYEPQFDNYKKITKKSKNPILNYELIPNYEGKAFGGFVSINSFGFRGTEVCLKKPKDVYRIAVIGDSWAFGWGVNQNKVFATVLEEMLNENKDQKKFEILNFALFGYNLQQQEIILKERVINFNPNIVIFAYNINDLEGLTLDYVQNDKSIWNKKKIYNDKVKKRINFNRRIYKILHKIERFGNKYSHFFRLFDNVLRGMMIKYGVKQPLKKSYYSKFYEEESYELKFLKNAFHRINKISLRHKFEVIITYFPWMNEIMQDNPYEKSFKKVQKYAEKVGFKVLNLYPYFRGKNPKKLRLSLIDGHPTPLGHQIAANALYEYICQDFINILSE
jgi:lysophospholipase L1-like esterase